MFARIAAFTPVRRLSEWQRLRTPLSSGPLFLVHRRVYILPTRSGLAFACALVLMLIGSINYSLSLGYLMTFLLAGTAGVAMLHTYRNLVHLRIDPGKMEHCFAGESAHFELHVHNPSHYDRIAVDVLGTERPIRFDVARRGSATLGLRVQGVRRGWLPLPRLTIETRFPLGLFRAWGVLRFDMRALVYPAPDLTDLPAPTVTPAHGEALSSSRGSDDFFGLRPYQAGDSLRHIAWKNVARGGLLLTKVFAGRGAAELSFDYAALPQGMDTETRLSRLARWVVLADGLALQYSLHLPDQRIEAASGDAHRDTCLRALALYGLPRMNVLHKLLTRIDRRAAVYGDALVSTLLVLIGGIALASAPHAGRLPGWIGALAASILAWRVWAAWRGDSLPRRWLLVPLTLLIIGGVYMTHHTLFGRDAGVTLLVVLLALKLMEMRQMRDVVVTTVLAYFLALSAFFYSQTPGTALLSLGTVMLLTMALVGANAPHLGLHRHMKTAGMLLAQAVPIMVILFFLFPRVQGPLWGLPADAFSGMTGLSGTMSPGSISALSLSDEIAFRARFEGPLPTREQLYWRGPVLVDYDGELWTPGTLSEHTPHNFQSTGPATRYTVTLEPHNRHWLFALELSAQTPPGASITGDYQIRATDPVRSRIAYTLASYPVFRALGGASPAELEAARALPEGFNPRARGLAHEWRSTAQSDLEVYRRAIDYFRNGGYRYTLSPPLAERHPVDEFLFDSRAGFCEHFSAAFVVLMRAAGIPARVVTGYQGGEVNPVDDYFTVRQSDAHAWTEVWLGEPLGWVRTDPTAIAAPIRQQSGLAAAIPEAGLLPGLINIDASWLKRLRFNFEALNNYWNQWIIAYDPLRQRQLLARFGMPTPAWQDAAIMLLWVMGLAVLVLSLWLLRRVNYADPAQRAWLDFCTKLKRAGVARRASEGPLDYATRAALARPQEAATVIAIAQLYADLRYGPNPERQRLAQLNMLIKQFHPPSRP